MLSAKNPINWHLALPREIQDSPFILSQSQRKRCIRSFTIPYFEHHCHISKHHSFVPPHPFFLRSVTHLHTCNYLTRPTMQLKPLPTLATLLTLHSLTASSPLTPLADFSSPILSSNPLFGAEVNDIDKRLCCHWGYIGTYNTTDCSGPWDPAPALRPEVPPTPGECRPFVPGGGNVYIPGKGLIGKRFSIFPVCYETTLLRLIANQYQFDEQVSISGLAFIDSARLPSTMIPLAILLTSLLLW